MLTIIIKLLVLSFVLLSFSLLLFSFKLILVTYHQERVCTGREKVKLVFCFDFSVFLITPMIIIHSQLSVIPKTSGHLSLV